LFRVTSVVGLPPFAPRLDRLIQNQLLQSRGHQLTEEKVSAEGIEPSTY
jgi:hypothetical protein